MRGLRALARPPKAGLGMSIQTPTGRGPVKGATISTSYVSPGQPLYMDWDGQQAAQIAYLGHTYVMRCIRLRAETVAGLPFRCGPDPEDPSVTTPGAPLAHFLGPTTPATPGGPNPVTSSRALWCWSIVQHIVTGRFGWELQLDPDQSVVGVWPLVSAAINPIPSAPGAPRWFDAYEYNTPTGRIQLPPERVFYHWRPSVLDWRQAESPLKAAKLPIEIAIACDRHMASLLRNGMVASKIVISPPFEDPGDRRAWEDQFFSEFSGFDNAGKTIFAEAEHDYDITGKMTGAASVQVIDLAMKSVDAQLLQMVDEAKSDINIGLGVPKSLIGDASQRIYANADAEYRNFWTLTAVSDVAELQDAVNLGLAPRVGPDVGWWDLSQVVALQPPMVFQAPSLKDAIDEGVVTPEQAALLLQIPAATATGEDVATAPIGEELAEGASTMARSLHVRRVAPGFAMEGLRGGWMDAPEGWGWRNRPLNTYTLRSGRSGWGLVRLERQRIVVPRSRPAPVGLPSGVLDVLATVEGVRSRRVERGYRSALRAAGLLVQAADSGRVLMLQRSISDPTDPAAGTWDIPGGKLENGEDAQDGAVREFGEETGAALPPGRFTGSWTSPNGIYRGHLYSVASEGDVPINTDPAKRAVLNPDDPDGDDIEVAAWWNPAHLVDNPAVRPEVRESTDWGMLGVSPTLDDDTLADLDRLGDQLASVL